MIRPLRKQIGRIDFCLGDARPNVFYGLNFRSANEISARDYFDSAYGLVDKCLQSTTAGLTAAPGENYRDFSTAKTARIFMRISAIGV